MAGRVGLTGWGSGCWSVLVDESNAGGASMDWCSGLDRGFVSFVVGCSLVEAAVGPVLVVVLDEVIEESVELALIPNQGAVE